MAPRPRRHGGNAGPKNRSPPHSGLLQDIRFFAKLNATPGLMIRAFAGRVGRSGRCRRLDVRSASVVRVSRLEGSDVAASIRCAGPKFASAAGAVAYSVASTRFRARRTRMSFRGRLVT